MKFVTTTALKKATDKLQTWRAGIPPRPLQTLFRLLILKLYNVPARQAGASAQPNPISLNTSSFVQACERFIKVSYQDDGTAARTEGIPKYYSPLDGDFKKANEGSNFAIGTMWTRCDTWERKKILPKLKAQGTSKLFTFHHSYIKVLLSDIRHPIPAVPLAIFLFRRPTDSQVTAAAPRTINDYAQLLKKTFHLSATEQDQLFDWTTGDLSDADLSDTEMTREDVLQLLCSPSVAGDARRGDNIIFFGPPGTGKSHLAEETAGDFPVPTRVLFHPEYTYSDFFGAYKPVVGSETGNSTIIGADGKRRSRPVSYFAFTPGPLLKAVARALTDSANHHYLIIDEINRGDCAAIFGDILQLLDRAPDGSSKYYLSLADEPAAYLEAEGVQWILGEERKLRFPANFTILATMNTSDQNLYPMDSAFKRRWQWRSCRIDFKPLLDILDTRPVLHDAKATWDWEALIKTLNTYIARYRQEDKLIGPWFILPAGDGTIDNEAFGSKCLYYLWHDVFKDDQSALSSPFCEAASDWTFHRVQELFSHSGLEAIFKPEFLRGVVAASPAAAAIATQEPQDHATHAAPLAQPAPPQPTAGQAAT
ncbi:MAG TPA: AAA family ATPase [Verrucomicrobiota bacterium]|nr:AAA family ATPase [Verrucomicrobiota bacterium]